MDSSQFIDFCAGEDDVVAQFENAEALLIPCVVLAEIRAGAGLTRHGGEQASLLQELLQQPGVRAAHSTDAAAHHYATIYQQLRRKGTPIPSNDIWIAALALEHSLVRARVRSLDKGRNFQVQPAFSIPQQIKQRSFWACSNWGKAQELADQIGDPPGQRLGLLGAFP